MEHAVCNRRPQVGEQFLSKPMHEFLAAKMPDTLATARLGVPLGNAFDLILIFAQMRSAGIDLAWWFRAKSVAAIFGPMAEAKLVGKPFDEVWNDYSAEADVKGVIRNGTFCGMTIDQISDATEDNIYIAEKSLAPPEVWRAILALASKLKPGRTSGRAAAGIITRTLAISGSAKDTSDLAWAGASLSL